MQGVVADAKPREAVRDQPPANEEVTNEEILTAEEVLANPLEDDAYADAVRCLSSMRYRRVEIVGNVALAFHGRGDEAWLNILPRRCPGLREGMILSIEQRSLRVCARDRFKGLPRTAIELSTPFCTLGQFQRVTPERLDAMRDALAARGRNRAVARTIRSANDGDASRVR